MVLTTNLAEATVSSDSNTIPSGLLAAFHAYETALLSNDIDTLNSLFAPGPDTVRGDGTNLLIGYDAIVGFRSARTSIPTRRIDQLLVRTVNENCALIMASTIEPSTNATGLQTQLWSRNGDWQVVAAHVSLPKKAAPVSLPPCEPQPAPPFDSTVWRVLGNPLVPALSDGPLRGITLAVKDLFALTGHRTGLGNPRWLEDHAPQTITAPIVTTLLEAGAEVTGIACTDEFAYSLAGQNAHYGVTPNIRVPGAISGGSTSGPAAAVALGQVSVGLGTDTAGSIRVPASYQGLVGIRTTHGALDTTGVAPLARSFDTVGWLTRDVTTSLAVAEQLIPGERTGQFRRTVTFPAALAYSDPEVVTACEAECIALIDAGVLPAVVDECDIDSSTLDTWFTAFRVVQAFEAWQVHGDWITEHPDSLGDDVAQRFAIASLVSVSEVSAARETTTHAREYLRELLDGAVLVLPSTSSAAPALDASAETIESCRGATLHLTALASLAGVPAVSVPSLHTADGRPVGLGLIGAASTDLDLLDLALRIERTHR